MMKFSGRIFSFILSALCVQGVMISGNNDMIYAQGNNKYIVGYLPDWSYGYYKDMDFTDLTHINIAFCNPDTSGNLSCYIPDAEMKKIVDKAHENGVKVLASLGGAGGSGNYPALVRDEKTRNDFCEKIIDFCEKYNLDGIDLDIEGEVEASFWDYYDQWCLYLRKRCDEKGYLLTTASARWIARRVSDTAFSYFDFINVMAYDNDGSKVSHAGYDFSTEMLDYFNITRGIEKDRLVLGVPFYGRGYNPDGSLSWSSYVPFSELVEQDRENYDRDEYNGIAYNGAETMKKKCDLADDYAGIMIWEVTQDAKGEYSLLDLIKKELTDSVAVKGDINSDGKCDISDLVQLMKYLTSQNILQNECMDINEDGKINIADICLLKEMLL